MDAARELDEMLARGEIRLPEPWVLASSISYPANVTIEAKCTMGAERGTVYGGTYDVDSQQFTTESGRVIHSHWLGQWREVAI